MKEEQYWASDRPKLENSRKLRGIYFIEPEDKECYIVLVGFAQATRKNCAS